MESTKLVKLLRSFSSKEMKDFQNFVNISIDVKKSKVKTLLQEICKYSPGYGSEGFTKTAIHKKLYPASSYNDARLRKLISYLTALAEDFLIQLNLKKDEFSRKIFLLKELSSRKLSGMFEHELGITEKQTAKLERSTEYYYYRYRFLNLSNSYFETRKRSFATANYQSEADSFFQYFFIEALNIYMYLLLEKKISGKEYDLVLLKEVLYHLKTNQYPEVPVISVYNKCVQLILTEKDEHYFELKVKKNILDVKLNRETLRIIYIVLQNFCVSKIKNGNSAFRREVFELQKEFVSSGFHLAGKYIHIFTFLNIVSEALSVGELEWTEKFIYHNRTLIEPAYRFEVENLAFAKLEFAAKKYEKALTHLGKINSEQSHFKLSVKTLMLKIYYELGLIDSADSLMDSSKHFISRDKLLPEIDKQNNLNFLKYYKDILILKSGTGTDADRLQKEISSSSNLIEKDWLLEKTGKLNREGAY